MLTIAGGIVLAVVVLICWRPILITALCLAPSAVACFIALANGADLYTALAWSGVPVMVYTVGFFAWRRFTVSGRLAAQLEKSSEAAPLH